MKKGWSIRTAWNKLKLLSDSEISESIKQILYRPYDIRWIFYHDSLIERSRKDVMCHMIENNWGLITVRQVAEGVFNHTTVTKSIVESRITLSNKGIAYVFPLYLYIGITDEMKPNIISTIYNNLSYLYSEKPTPEDIFYYIYSVLYSNTYRKKYAEFLKIDFPRVPFTKDYELFKKMGNLGKKLVDLHLLKSPKLEQPIAKFPAEGENDADKLNYDEKGERVYINKSQYFERVPQEVWEYQIGGYQVCSKWLKDRKGRKLSLDDIKHYCRIVTSLQKTIEIQKEIDKLYPEVEKDIIATFDQI